MESRIGWSVIAVVLGIALLAAAFVWRTGSRPWSDEQARSYNAAAADLYRLRYQAAAARELAQRPNASGSAQARQANSVLGSAADAGIIIDPSTATLERTSSQ